MSNSKKIIADRTATTSATTTNIFPVEEGRNFSGNF